MSVAILSLVLFAGTARGETLAEKRNWIQTETRAKELMEKVTASCGAGITAEFDKASFQGWDFDQHNPASDCSGTWDKIAYLCDKSPEGKRAVVAQIKKLNCAQRAPSAPEEYSLAGGVFHFTIFPGGRNSADDTWLKRHLGGGQLADAEKWADTDRALEARLLAMNSKCETKIAYRIDKTSFVGRKDALLAPSDCDQMMRALMDRCENEAKRGQIVQKVKMLECRSSRQPESHFTAYKDGTLTFDLGMRGGFEPARGNVEMDRLIR